MAARIRERRFVAPHAPERGSDNVQIPDFDFFDMLWGFPVAVSLAHLNVPATLLTGLAWAAQKKARNTPGLGGALYDLALGALPLPRWLERALPAPQPRELPDAATGETIPIVAQTAPAGDLFAALDERPHRLVIGHTGGGKTTLLHELATAWASAGHNVMVCDPDAAPGQWPRCRAVGGGDDYDGIARVLQLTANETARRRQQRKDGRTTFPPLHLVIDEVQDVIAEVPGAWEVLEPVIRRGRKLGMHLTLGVQDSAVDTLDLDGKSALLNNLVTVDLYKEPNGARVARFGKGKAARTMPVPALRDPESLIVRRPQPARAAPTERPVTASVEAVTGDTTPLPDPFLAALLAVQSDTIGVTLVSPDAALGRASFTPDTKTETNTHGVGFGVTPDTNAAVLVSGGGGTVNVFAHATAGRQPFGRRRPNVRAMRQRARQQQRKETLQEAYARLRAAGVPSFRQAYKQLGGNDEEARAAWKAAAPEKGIQ